MADSPAWRYPAAMVASALSTLGWLAALASGAATAYFAFAGGPVSEFFLYALAALAGGVLFALIEARLYRVDR